MKENLRLATARARLQIEMSIRAIQLALLDEPDTRFNETLRLLQAALDNMPRER